MSRFVEDAGPRLFNAPDFASISAASWLVMPLSSQGRGLGAERDSRVGEERWTALDAELWIADTEEKLGHMFGAVKNKLMYGKKVKASSVWDAGR